MPQGAWSNKHRSLHIGTTKKQPKAMKLGSLLIAVVLFVTRSQAQVWISYDWFNHPPEPSPIISALILDADTTWIGTVSDGIGWSTDDICRAPADD